MTTTYEIVECPAHNDASGHVPVTWTVVEYVDGECKGGDRHWLSRANAVSACIRYRHGMSVHPDPRAVA